ncbi:MAG: hypothetical protein ABSC93_23860 [Bryobacteraceae bacterium]
MTTLQQVHDFLDLDRFAVVGVSRQPRTSPGFSSANSWRADIMPCR